MMLKLSSMVPTRTKGFRFHFAALSIATAVLVTGGALYAQTGSTASFTISDKGGVSLISQGGGSTIGVGYSRVQASSGSAPSGVAIFGFKQNNILVTEAGVPATRLLTSGRFYAQVCCVAGNIRINTGVAIANPNAQDATVNFYLTGPTGIDAGSGSVIIPANGQIAKFLDQAPFNSGIVTASFTFTSSVPIAVIALRGFTNERNEFLVTTLGVTDLTGAQPSTEFTLPHFADGGGWSTQVVLVNPTNQAISGSVQFFQPNGSAANVVSGVTPNTVNYQIAARGFVIVVTLAAGTQTTTGLVLVKPASGSSPSAQAIFSYRQSGVTVAEAGVAGVSGNAFRMYTEITASSGIGAIQTGLAISTNTVSATGSATNVNLELFKSDGTTTGLTSTVTVPANGQVAKFLHEIFSAVALPFRGVVRISAPAGINVSAVGLRGRYNERGDFLITTTPPTNESATTTSELFFPHIVDGGGYTTQFALYSGSAGQTSSGSLRFLTQAGQALNLTLTTQTSSTGSTGGTGGSGGTASTYIGLWKILRAGPNAETDVGSISEQTFDIRTDGTIVYKVSSPFTCQQNFTYTATGTTSGTWRSTLTATTCLNDQELGIVRSGTWTLQDANTLEWYYPGTDNPGDQPNRIIMTRLR